MQDIGRMLILFGFALALVGGVIVLLGKVPGLPLGRLPGDIVIQQPGFSCFIPIATSVVLSLVLTIVLNVILRVLNR